MDILKKMAATHHFLCRTTLLRIIKKVEFVDINFFVENVAATSIIPDRFLNFISVDCCNMLVVLTLLVK